jgi:hypothetical protein
MAGTIVTGNISTEEVLPESRVVDMDEKIRQLDDDESQFTTLTDRTSKRTALREKVNWLEREDFPRQVTSDAQTSGSTTINVSAGQGKIVQANDLLRNMRTGEGIKVVSVATDALTVARGVGASTGGIAAAAINAGDILLVVADAQPQGSDFPTPRYLAAVLGYNYTEITRTTWSFTGTQTAIELYGGREPAQEAIRKAREHKRKWEAIGFFGARAFSAAVAPDNEPQGFAGGALEFVQSNVLDAAGPLTPSAFDAFVAQVLAYGSGNHVLFASPTVVMNMSSWNRTGMGSQWAPAEKNVHGAHVDAFISGAYGYRLPVVVKREWAQFPVTNKGFGGYAFLLDLDMIEQIPLRDRDTKLLTDRQPAGKDVVSAEYMREATYEFAQNRRHGKIIGVTAPA